MLSKRKTQEWLIWGSALSPFTLKVIACLRYKGIAVRMLPAQGGLLENLLYALQVEAIKKKRLSLTWPVLEKHEVMPLVPYLFASDGRRFYDSSSIVEYIEQHGIGDSPAPLLEQQNGLLAFLMYLLEDFSDEWLPGMVYYNRWNRCAENNRVYDILYHEVRNTLLRPARHFFAQGFVRRQVRRMPFYLNTTQANKFYHLEADRQPPYDASQPVTDALHEQCFSRLIEVLDDLLQQQTFLLGASFTLADAAIYSMLAMNLEDPDAAQLMQSHSPALYRWLHRIKAGDFARQGSAASPEALSNLSALVDEVLDTYVPYMQQNEKAYLAYIEEGVADFDEPAFDAHGTAFRGRVKGHEFVAAVDTFKLKSWRKVRGLWESMADADRALALQYFPRLSEIARQDISFIRLGKS